MPTPGKNTKRLFRVVSKPFDWRLELLWSLLANHTFCILARTCHKPETEPPISPAGRSTLQSHQVVARARIIIVPNQAKGCSGNFFPTRNTVAFRNRHKLLAVFGHFSHGVSHAHLSFSMVSQERHTLCSVYVAIDVVRIELLGFGGVRSQAIEKA